MLTILIGIGLCVFLVWVVWDCTEKGDNARVTSFALAGVILLFATIIGTVIPSNYAEAKIVEEIELVSLSNSVSSEGTGRLFYVTVDANNVYSYRYEVNNEYGIKGDTYKVDTVSGKVTEVESVECTTPVLKIYERKPVFSWFALWFANNPKYEYVFYVPQGTVVKDAVLN